MRLYTLPFAVEAFLVANSKAITATPTYGGPKAGVVGGDKCPGMDAADVAAVDAVLDTCLAPRWRSGLQLMNDLRHAIQVLPTGCAAIDALLGGGLREGTVVELAGETASGKTQLCLSAAATTAFRNEAVLYIDTTDSFAPERVVQMAEAEAGVTDPQMVDSELASRVLRCISVMRPSNVYDLLGILDRLSRALQDQQQQQQQQAPQPAGSVGQPPQPHGGTASAGGAEGAARYGARVVPRLLIVDSVSALLSTVVGNNQHMQGTALLTSVGRLLKQLADAHAMAVLVTNHVTSAGRGGGGRSGGRSGGGGDGPTADRETAAAVGIAGLKPALGEQWRAQPHMRVQLSLDESQPAESGMRVATLVASPLQACGQKLEFRIVAAGLA